MDNNGTDFKLLEYDIYETVYIYYILNIYNLKPSIGKIFY